MGHEVFVSYKYSDGRKTKDKIMGALGRSGHYYNGEKGFCKLDVADSTLKQYLADMIFGTTVTVVVISPEVVLSNWVEWEIKYSLETHTRNDRTNRRNGIVCVIQNRLEYKNDYYGYRQVDSPNWAYNVYSGTSKKIKKEVLPELIIKNMQDTIGEFGSLWGHLDSNESNLDFRDYCIVVSEDTFLRNPSKYINEAYERSKDTINYEVHTRK